MLSFYLFSKEKNQQWYCVLSSNGYLETSRIWNIMPKHYGL